MYNPLYQLTPKALIGLIRQGNHYWVKQSYPRGREMGVDQSFLLKPNHTGGIDILSEGPTLEEGLINEAARTIIIELDNWTI